MDAVSRMWERWVAFTDRDMDARPLALVRILVSACLVGDLLRVWQLGLVDFLFRPYAQGGLSVVRDPAFVLDALLGPAAGPVAWAVSLVCFALVGLGVGVRPAIVVGVLFHAQLGHAFPPGDRAIDRILRTTLLILLFSGAHHRFALTGERRDRIPAWPAELLTFFLVLVYMNAGVAKLMQQPRWLALTGTPVLYRILTDPMSAWVDPQAVRPLFPLFRIGGWATIVTECGAFLLLTRLRPWWALGLAPIHLGIALTMKLGMFSWGMLALYPVLWREAVVVASAWVGSTLVRRRPAPETSPG